MVKIIFFADSHLGFDTPLKPKKEKRRRGTDFLNNFDYILDYAKINKADLVIHGGDLFFRTRMNGFSISPKQEFTLKLFLVIMKAQYCQFH